MKIESIRIWPSLFLLFLHIVVAVVVVFFRFLALIVLTSVALRKSVQMPRYMSSVPSDRKHKSARKTFTWIKIRFTVTHSYAHTDTHINGRRTYTQMHTYSENVVCITVHGCTTTRAMRLSCIWVKCMHVLMYVYVSGRNAYPLLSFIKISGQKYTTIVRTI